MPLHFSQVGYDDKWIEGRLGRRVGMDVFVPSPCKWINGNLCGVQDKKPEYCKGWPENMGRIPSWLVNMGCKFYE